MQIFITRKIPEAGIALLKEKGHEVEVSTKDGVLTKEELLLALRAKQYDAVISLLTDKIDGEVMDAAPTVKIFANYAVGYDNIDLAAAKERGKIITNTPDVLTNSVAEHAVALLMALAKRIPEGDRFMREGKYIGWAPELLLGTDILGKTLGILGTGRIGSRVAEIAAKGLGMRVIYYDIAQNAMLEKNVGASFRKTPEEVLAEADAVSIHVPLLDSTRHLMNADRLAKMKKTAYLINTSRGPVIDEAALTDALKNGVIRGAALDVFEHEPNLAPGLSDLSNVIITPHTASATEETRAAMSRVAAENIIAVLEGKSPITEVKK
ncbi:MAG: D-glycerate dehydrogenase [Patescibacteria group bacterium]